MSFRISSGSQAGLGIVSFVHAVSDFLMMQFKHKYKLWETTLIFLLVLSAKNFSFHICFKCIKSYKVVASLLNNC